MSIRKYIFTYTFILFSNLLSAQYLNAVGLRGGLHSGIGFRHMLTNDTALEGILHSRWHGVELVGLIEYQQDLSSDGLYWYYGYGAHAGFYDNKYTYWEPDGNTTVIGIDGILAIEYKFFNAPVAIAMDWKPYFNLLGNTGFFGNGGAISLRFTF